MINNVNLEGITTEVLLFDLGGVLVEFSGVRDVARLLPHQESECQIRERFNCCPHMKAFGNGTLSSREFGELFVRDWRICLTPEAFLQEFRTWSRCLLPGAEQLLATLGRRFRLAALSNSNELHWERNSKDIGVTGLFELAISSHQVGCSKPDPAIYQIALDRLGVSPQAVMFFDDVEANVAAAATAGIRAFRVDGVSAIQDRLSQEGLI
jgi:glucose-1-phosphatase